MALSQALHVGSRHLARSLRLSEEEEEIIRYGLELIANYVLSAAALLGVALALGTGVTTIAAAVPAATIRLYAGGWHASSRRNCIIITTVAYGAAGWLAAVLGARAGAGAMAAGALPVLGLTAYAVWRYAPMASPQKPIASPSRRARLRRCARLLVTWWTAVIISLLVASSWTGTDAAEQTSPLRSLALGGTLGLSVQSLTLWPGVNRRLATGDESESACTLISSRREG